MPSAISRRSVLIISILLICLPALAAAGTVFNNFSADHDGWGYNWGTGWTVAGEDVDAQYGVEQAMGFTAAEGGTLCDLWVAFWYVPIDPGVDVVTLRLTHRNGDTPPRIEDVIEEWTITEFEDWYQWNEPQHLIGNGTTILEAGESYWFWAVGGATTWTGWCMNEDSGAVGSHTIRREGEDWLPVSNETLSVFRVDVTPTTAASQSTWGAVKALY